MCSLSSSLVTKLDSYFEFPSGGISLSLLTMEKAQNAAFGSVNRSYQKARINFGSQINISLFSPYLKMTF